MSKLTTAQWIAQIDEAGGDISRDELINLVFSDDANATMQQMINQMHVTYDGMYNYMTGMFPTREWQDWSGSDELGKVYHSPYIPFDMGIFQRSMQICDPQSANECHTDYCEIPRGGITNLPAHEMYKTGFKTQPMCIANIRTSAQAKQIAEMIVKERFAVDEQVANIFYTMALIRMLGHKTVLEYADDNQGGVSLIDNANSYNPLQGGRFAYMQPLFPAAGNLQNIMPLDLNFLDMYGSMLARSKDTSYIARGPRGEPIYELWHPEDWYRQEVIDNQEYVDKTKYLMKPELLPGYRMAGASSMKEIVGNFSMRQNDSLPRFTESSQGGITVVQPYKAVDADVGTIPLHNYREYQNAPFYMACIIGKDVGEILTRPALSTGIEGMPIMPITGGKDSEWSYRNEYERGVNEDRNMPHFRKRFEMGFKMNNPNAGRGFIFRAKKFRLRPIQTCDLRPIFTITPASLGCDITTIGCNPLNERASNNIMDDSAGFRKVKCSSKVCGDSENRIYRVTVRRENIDSINPDQNPLTNCGCGDTIQVFIGDEDGDAAKIRDAVVLDYIRPNVVNPNPVLILKLASALTGAECIQSIGCKDSTPNLSTVVTCADNSDDDTIEEGSVKFILDSAVACNVGATVELKYYTDADVLIDTIYGTIISVNPDTMTYVISSEEADFACDMFENQSYITVACD